MKIGQTTEKWRPQHHLWCTQHPACTWASPLRLFCGHTLAAPWAGNQVQHRPCSAACNHGVHGGPWPGWQLVHPQMSNHHANSWWVLSWEPPWSASRLLNPKPAAPNRRRGPGGGRHCLCCKYVRQDNVGPARPGLGRHGCWV